MRISLPRSLSAIALALVFGLTSSMPSGSGLVRAAAPAAKPHGGQNALASSEATALREGMRRLWEDHIVWTRLRRAESGA